MKNVISTRCFLMLAALVVVISVVLVGGSVVRPVDGYYRSQHVTCLDSECKGYLRLLGGQVYVVNFRKNEADCFWLGTYSHASGDIVLSDQINTNVHYGKVSLWGIRWEHAGDWDEFTRRSFIGRNDKLVTYPVSQRTGPE